MKHTYLYIYTLLFLASLFCSCADKYRPFKSRYQFKSSDGSPDYSNLDYWAAHPWKWDPSDSIPAPLRNEPTDSSVDVFFLHPTSYTDNITGPNAAIDDDYLNAKTDYSSILYQASVFNQQCRVFAPRYRQANIKMFFTTDKEKAAAAFDLAYEDLKAAFEYYLETWNNGRPIIIAAHSQGSLLGERLLKDYFDNKPLQKKLVAAYILGWPVVTNYFSSLQMCADSLQTGCICSWRTLKNGFLPSYLKKDTSVVLVTNPLTWTTGNEFASRKLNKGSVLVKFNTIYPHTADAQIHNGLLYTRRPKFPGSFLYRSRNYHIGDINLYYLNIRENIKQRIGMFWKQ